jgi:regulator of protease activity HflC (stomatin/prohibitin superfamily)
MFRTLKIRSFEAGLYFRDGEFRGLFGEGRHWFCDPMRKVRVDVVSLREPRLVHEKLDVIARSGVLDGRALTLDLQDHERGLVWIDGRFAEILLPGQHALWTTHRTVKVEVVDVRGARFTHAELATIARHRSGLIYLETHQVEEGRAGVLLVDGKYIETLRPGRYVFWRNVAHVQIVQLDLRETTLDVTGQEIITADKVTLRMNAVVVYRIADPHRAVTASDNVQQALYRETQLALRGVVGGRELDAFLTDKDAVASEMEEIVRRRAGALGVEIVSAGVRDVILPGDMKDLMNKVIEAKKAAEANFIVRREETAAMRSQANTAKLLENNPTLMRLRELEALEKIAAAGNLNVVLGEQGLANRIVNLL